MTDQQQSTFRFTLKLPKRVQVLSKHLQEEGESFDRDRFFDWMWERFTEGGLLGIHEGTLLSAEAAEQGLETDSWTVDAGEAPRERDWVAGSSEADATFYFDTDANARQARAILIQVAGLTPSEVEEEKPQDWDAQWKASFLSSPDGVPIPPFWRVVPPWNDEKSGAGKPGEKILKINPGAGFGTGTHETTQLCLQAMAELSMRKPLQGARVLDFGSGSGILSIGAALLGASVDGVEIDPLAIDNALENARLNGVESRIAYSKTLGGADGPYRLVIANILRPVLLEFASKLIARLDPTGSVILSGLIEKDVESVVAAYTPLIGAGEPKVMALGEWRALVWHR